MNHTFRHRGLRFARCAALLPLFLLVGLCASPLPLQLFYRPPGTFVETYRRAPGPLELVVYPSPRTDGVGLARGGVIFIHGGGWSVSGAGVPTFSDWDRPLRDAGLRAFALEHRVPPKYRGRDQIEDCVAAVNYVRTNAERFGIPGDRLALIGFSSGGHLAVMTALSMSRPRPGVRSVNDNPVRAVVSFYAPLDPEALLGDSGDPEVRRLLVNYLPRFDAETVAAAEATELRRNFYRRALNDVSPVKHLHRYAPPMLLVHGVKDELVPIEQSRTLYAAAVQVRPDLAVLREVPRGDHHFIRSRSRWARDVEREAIEFIVERM